MAGDEALVLLDNIVLPGEGRVTAQYQAAYASEVDGSRAVVAGDSSRLVIEAHGPTISLDVEEKDFGRSWVYKRWADNGWLSWHKISGTYTPEARRPLVTVMMPAATDGNLPQARVTYGAAAIDVTLPSGREIRFVNREGEWRTEKP